MSNQELLDELSKKQRKNIPQTKKFQYTDLKRISKKISKSIFNDKSCSLWKGYVTNANNISKGVYINFYFRKNKYALHRLLYINYKGDLNDNEYIKYSCPNKGKCCNINHMIKYKYIENKKNNNINLDNKNNDKIENNNKNIETEHPDDFLLKF